MGLTEAEACFRYGEKTKVYTSSFTVMYTTITSHRQPCKMNLVCAGMEEKAAAIKMGASKADFDAVVAIHSTSAEEFVAVR